MKICSKCKLELSLDMFSKNKYAKDGLQIWCRVCANERSTAYYKVNPEKVIANAAAWHKANPEKVTASVNKMQHSIQPGVYMVKNLITGSIYVGQSETPYQRKTQHMSIRKSKKGFNTNQWLNKDLNKYGREAFVFEILEHCAKEDLKEREDFYIRTLKPYYNSATN